MPNWHLTQQDWKMAIMAGLWMSFCDNCKYVNITEATYLRLSQGSCFVCLPTFTSTQISFSLLFSIYFIHAEGITELWFRSCCHGNIFFYDYVLIPCITKTYQFYLEILRKLLDFSLYSFFFPILLLADVNWNIFCVLTRIVCSWHT